LHLRSSREYKVVHDYIYLKNRRWNHF
jgi:hypothetical protein